ncbi:hypothetical protein F4779DRAFT_384393 [Xylariaceae sp. FL0662B]|nr:hypothetical protein F4779DRAFT_384393 [Xylariaceae sp. FL0662B]
MPEIDPMLEDTKPELHDDSVMEHYPSPTVDAQDGAPFSYGNSHSDQQPQVPDQQDQSEMPEPPTTHQQQLRPSITSAEELQLAAQLSQGLSQGIPTMLDPNEDPNLRNMMVHHEAHEAQAAQETQGAQEAQGVQEAQEAREAQEAQEAQETPEAHEAHDTSLQQQDDQLHHDQIQEQNHQQLPHDDQSMPPHEPMPIEHHDQSLQHHQQHIQEQPLQNHEQQPQHQYVPDQHQQHHHQQVHLPPQQPQSQPPQHPTHHLSPQGTVEHLAQQFAAQAAALPDNVPPRKRSKVSRACDECRRKKVKCDSASEISDEPCTNCRRSAIRCLFSRIPQKRGPSKGYIKELADRIHHIEGKLASEGGNVDTLTELLSGARRDSADIFPPSGPTEENSRKRPYSSISGAEFGTPTSSRQATWSSEPRPIQPYQTPSGGSRPSYSANGLAPQPLSKPDSGTPSRPPAVMDTMSLDLNHNGVPRELDEGAFNGYLNVVHPYFPLLAATKARVESQLAQCPVLLRDAFVEALYGTMQSFVSVPGLYTNGDIGTATRMITDWEADPCVRTPTMNLVHLQTLILAAVATDNYGPPSLKGEHGGPPKGSILGRAVGLAYSMRLHMSSLRTGVDVELDLDLDEVVAARAWWTLVMLDRWNAISTASPLFIPNDSVVILPSLGPLLGENAFHLTRLSNILGHFAPVSLAPPHALSPDSGAAPILSSFFNLSIELFREILPSSITPSSHPILHLVYWHCRLLAYLFQTNAKSTDILWPCGETVELLLTHTQLCSPLNHHFFCLTTLALVELSKVEKTRDEATNLLRQLLESNLAPSTWDAVIRDRIAESIRPSTAQAAASQSLQHLADLATATDIDTIKPEKNAEPVAFRTSDNYDDVGFDPRTLTRGGYLNVLTEGRLPTMR